MGGVLDAFLALRTPPSTAASGDSSLAEQLTALEADAVLPERLHACLDDSDDGVLTDSRAEELRAVAVVVRKAQEPLYEQLSGLRMPSDALDTLRWQLVEERDDLRHRLEVAEAALTSADDELEAQRLQLARLQEAYDAVRARLDSIEGHLFVRVARRARSRLRGRQ